MPLYTQAELAAKATGVPQRGLAEARPTGALTAQSGIAETIGAFFSSAGGEFVPSASFALAAENLARLGEFPDESFDPIAEIQGTKWEASAGEFVDVFNREQYNRRVNRLEDEETNRGIIERSPFITQLVAGLVTGAADPTNWIAFAGPIAKGLKAGTRATAAREFMVSGAKGGALSAVAQESVLQEANSFRTWQESVSSIALSTVFTGGLGSVIGRSVGKRAEELALAKSARGALDARLRASPEVVAAVQAETDAATAGLRLGINVMPEDVKARIAGLENRATGFDARAAEPAPKPLPDGVMTIGEDGAARLTPAEYVAEAARLRREAEDLRSPYAEPPAAANVSRETPENVVPMKPSDAVPRVGTWSNPAEGGLFTVGKSLSAAANDVEIKLQGGRLVAFLQAPSRFLGPLALWMDSPQGRMLTSPLMKARDVAMRLGNTLRLTMNKDSFVNVMDEAGNVIGRDRVPGVATPVSVEAAVGRYTGMNAAVERQMKEGYVEYRREMAGRTEPQRMERARIAAADTIARGVPAGVMTDMQFRAAAYDVIQNGTPSGIKQVDELAAVVQKQMDELVAQALYVRALDPDAKQTTAENWIMRVWDREAIKGNTPLIAAIGAKYWRTVADQLENEAIEARKVVVDLEGQREALLAEMSPDEQRVYLAEGKVREAENRYDEAVKGYETARDAYNAAADRAAILRMSPESGRMRDVTSEVDNEAGIAHADLVEADAELDAAKAARDAARNTFKIYENTTDKWPVALERAKIERRNSTIDSLRAQAYQARNALKKLEAELQTHGASVEKYAEWLSLREQNKPRDARPTSLVEHITSTGKDGTQVAGIRIWVEDANGNRVVTPEGQTYREIVKDYIAKTSSGNVDVRARLSRLISDDERAPTVSEASERYRGFVKSEDETFAGVDDYEINDFLAKVGDDLAALRGPKGVVDFGEYGQGGVRRSHVEKGRVYQVAEADAVEAWREFDDIRDRKRELESDADFRSGREVTRLLNGWRERAAARYDAVERDLLATISERDKMRDALDARVSRAKELAKNRATLDKRIAAEKKRADEREGIAQKSDEDLVARTRGAINEILGVPGEITPWAATAADKRGPFAERSWLIPNNFDAGPLEIGGVTYSGRIDQFIVKDLSRVMTAMTRNMGPDIELHRAFGSVNLEKEMQDITDDADSMIALSDRQQEADLQKPLDRNVNSANMTREEWESVPRVKDNPKARERAIKAGTKRRQKILKEAEDMRNVLKANVETLRGTYTNGIDPDQLWVRTAEDIKNLNNVSLMGGTVPSSIADPFIIANHFSMGELIRGIRASITDWPAFKEEMKRIGLEYGQGTDVMNSIRSNKTADLNTNYRPNNRISATIHWLSQRMGNVSLLSPWTDYWKTLDVMLAQNRILVNAEKYAAGGDIGDIERAFMRDHFLDEGAMVLIAQQQTHVRKVGSLRVAESGNWTSDEARRVFTAAMNKNADFNVITPGLDKPIWMRTQMGGVIGQFKSFSFVSMSRTIAANVQRNEAQAYLGMALLVQGGALSYLISSVLKGEDPFEEPPEKWAAEAIDRSGLVGYLGEINAMADKFGIGINTQLGFKPNSRYVSRSWMDQALGPTFGRFANLGGALQAVTSSDIDLTGKDLGNLRSLVPYQNVPIVPKFLMDSVERGVAQTLGIEPRESVRRDRPAD